MSKKEFIKGKNDWVQPTYKDMQGLIQQGIAYDPFQDVLARTLVLLPHNGTEAEQKKLKAHYAKYPSRGIDDMCKLMDRVPGYSKTVQSGGNTTNNLILNLGELSLSQKKKLLKEKLNKLGISDVSEIPILDMVKKPGEVTEEVEELPKVVGENRIKDED